MYHQVDRLRRDMRNNGRIYEDVAKILKESVVSCAKISKRYNATYGEDDFNDGMLQAAMLDASVGGCSSATRNATASSPDDRYSVNPDVLTLPLDLAEVRAESYSSGKL